MSEEMTPLPTEIIIELTPTMACALEAEAIANDRTVEYVAQQWLAKATAQWVESFRTAEVIMKRGPDPSPIDTRRERLAMTRTLRLAVLTRDNFTCVYCGAGREKKLHVDHVVAIVSGGKTEMANLQTLCLACNLGKSQKPDARANVVEMQARK